MKINTTWFSVLFGVVLSFSTPAKAQDLSLAHLFPGYEPTILASSQVVDRIFDQMPMGFRGKTFLSGGSQCFHRAQIWSYDLYRNQHINTMKVFVFYTHAYKEAYKDQFHHKFDWWFHVAPYVLASAPDGALQEWAIDPTFADKPMNIADWSQLFVDTHHKCAEFVPYSKFRNEVENGPNAVVGWNHCYIVRVPAVDFDPNGVEAREAGEVQGYQWNYQNISTALDQAPLRSKRDYFKQRLGF